MIPKLGDLFDEPEPEPPSVKPKGYSDANTFERSGSKSGLSTAGKPATKAAPLPKTAATVVTSSAPLVSSPDFGPRAEPAGPISRR